MQGQSHENDNYAGRRCRGEAERPHGAVGGELQGDTQRKPAARSRATDGRRACQAVSRSAPAHGTSPRNRTRQHRRTARPARRARATLMILVDANLLLYAYNQDSPGHAVARAWLQSEISSGRPLRPSQAPTAISTASTASRRSIRFSSQVRPGPSRLFLYPHRIH